MTEWNLDSLKKNYVAFREKYSLPSFDELNIDFHIEKVAEAETDFLLREIRGCITEKFFSYLRFIESIINPSNSPMFIFAITKTLGVPEREKLVELYKKLSRIDIDIVELDLYNNEEKEANSIKEYFVLWQEIKKELILIVEVIKKNWGNKIETSTKGYFG